MAAIWTQGTTFWMETAPAAGTYKKVGGFVDLTPFSATVETRDVTTLEDKVRKYGPGLSDFGDVTGTLYFDPGNVDHDASAGLLSYFGDGSETIKAAIGFDTTAGDWMFFEGVLSSFQLQAAANDSLRATLSIKLSGEPTWSTTAPALPV